MSAADLFQFLVESSPDALSHHTVDGVFLSASSACRDVFGRDPGELLGRPLAALLKPEAADDLRARWAEALKSRRASLRYAIASGDAVGWVETRLRVVTRTPHDDPEREDACDYVVCSSSDITDKVSAERALAASLERASLAEKHRDFLVDMMPGLVWVAPVSPDLKRYHSTYMSDYLFKVTGYTAQEWIETPGIWSRILHPDDAERAREAATAALKDDASIPPYRLLAKDGRVLWVQSFARIERDASGTAVRMYGLTLDVTKYKEAEIVVAEALEKMSFLKQRLDTLISALPGIVWETWDAEHRGDKRPGFCSDHVEAIIGYSSHEWIAGPDAWLALVPEDERERVAKALAAIRCEDHVSLQHRVRAKDGRELWLEHHIVAARDEAGALIGARGIALDITQRERLRQENLRQAERLLELSAPILPITESAIVLPLIGTVDAARARHVLTSLLEGVVGHKARFVILDLTGVAALDAESAGSLSQAITAVRLLGAEVVITGVRPQTAQALVRLGGSLGAVATRSTLRLAVREILMSRGRR